MKEHANATASGSAAPRTEAEFEEARRVPSPPPSIGRIVHYVYPDGTHRPAIVVDVLDDVEVDMVQLQVFNDADAEGRHNDGRPAVDWQTSIRFDPEGEAGTWHYPERV